MRIVRVCLVAVAVCGAVRCSAPPESAAEHMMPRPHAPGRNDATIQVNTTAGFALGGNNEGGIDIASNAVTRGKPALGVGAWVASSTVFTTARAAQTSVA
jgi:hypothetical protein